MDTAEDKNTIDSGRVIIAALVASAIGALFYNLLPLYLGSAQDYKGLDNRSIGFLSSAFFLGYNVVTVSAFFWIRRLSWRVIVAVATPVAAMFLYLGTLSHSYALLLLSVAVSGGAFAAIYGVGTTILGDTSNPARWYGVKIAVEALFGAILLLLLPSLAIARWGFNGTVIGMIVIMVLLAPLLFWTPTRGSKAAVAAGMGSKQPEAVRGSPAVQTPYIWGALLATLIFFASASAIWAFVERIGAAVGHDSAAIGVMLSVTLVFAVLGSLAAAAIGGRFGNVKPFNAGSVIFIAGLVLLNGSQSFTLYAIGACLVTFAIGFMLPIAVTEIAELDVDGRYIVLSVPAIGIGAMAGPGIAGMLSQGGNFAPLLVLCAVLVAAASALIWVAAAHARPQVEPAA
jgi:predicted MFS family arabinose efflux permease